ncbi:MAG: hypothetical protein LUD51_03930 [Clostridia bacterium]|nr:hypothetical protein [Clostridia bacterium]
MKFRFRASYSTIAILAAFLFTLLSLIFCCLSSSFGSAEGGVYGVDLIGMIVTFCVLSMIFEAAAFMMDCVEDLTGKLYMILADVLRFASAALLIACFSVMIFSRGDLMGYIWFSDLEANNASAVSALSMSVVAWVFLVLSVAACATSIYGSFCKKTR